MIFSSHKSSTGPLTVLPPPGLQDAYENSLGKKLQRARLQISHSLERQRNASVRDEEGRLLESSFPTVLQEGISYAVLNTRDVARSALVHDIPASIRTDLSQERAKTTGISSSQPKVLSNAPQFEILESWTGYVEDINERENTFTAVLKSENHDRGDEIGDFSFDEVSPDDLELLAPGAIFYWNVGYAIERSSTKSIASTIRFRRAFLWKREIIDEAKSRAHQLAAWLREV